MTTPEVERGSPSPFPAGSTVLVVEDDPSVAELLTTALGSRGYTVIVTRTGEAALRAMAGARPDLVLLDLGLPDMDGLDVCRKIRHSSTVPVIVLTADGDTERKVQALDLGADDYVTKPFSTPELMARLRVAERHHRARGPQRGTGGSTAPTDGDSTEFDVAHLHIDVDAYAVSIDGADVRLTQKEFRLLELLARRAGRLVSHRLILDSVWDSDGGTVESLRVHVTNLRRKLGSDAGVELRTEPGVGYRLVVADEST